MNLRRACVLPVSLAAVCAFTLLSGGLALARGPQIVNEQFPIDYRVVVPCSGDEVVRLSGTLHVVFQATEDGQGGYHVTSHANWHGVEGVNEMTGESYRFISTGNSSFNTNGGLPFTSTMQNTSRVVGPGEGLIFYLHNVFHVTVNAEGELAAQFAHQSASCR